MTVAEIASVLSDGGVAIIPTDTVYGLAAPLDRPEAIARIFELKGRPTSKPLPVLGADTTALFHVATLSERALAMAATYWPGPLTLVVVRAAGFDVDLGGRAGEWTVAVRVPDRRVTLDLLRITGPLAVTSANRSGDEPAATPDAALAYFDLPILDDGALAGEVSTVLDVTGPEARLLREGAIPGEELRVSG